MWTWFWFWCWFVRWLRLRPRPLPRVRNETHSPNLLTSSRLTHQGATHVPSKLRLLGQLAGKEEGFRSENLSELVPVRQSTKKEPGRWLIGLDQLMELPIRQAEQTQETNLLRSSSLLDSGFLALSCDVLVKDKPLSSPLFVQQTIN